MNTNSEIAGIKLSGKLLVRYSGWHDIRRLVSVKYKVYLLEDSGQYLITSEFNQLFEGQEYKTFRYHIFDYIDEIQKSGLYPDELIDRILWK
mgnify:FL=1